MKSLVYMLVLIGCGSATGPLLPDAEKITLSSITVTPATTTAERGFDAPTQLTAMAMFSNATTKDVTSQVKWTSSAETIATVNDAGLLTPTHAGAAMINAALDGEMGTAMITVTDPTLVVASSGLDFFPANATGNIAPTRSIRGATTTIQSLREVAVKGSEVFVIDESGSSIDVFPVDGTGNIAPTRRIVGAATTLSNPYGIAIKDDEIFVTSASSILVFPLTATGNVAPTRTISGALTTLGTISIGLQVVGNELFVAAFSVDSILVFPADGNGNIAPLRTIAGSNTGFGTPGAVMVSNGELYVSSFSTNSITVFDPQANGNVGPLRMLAGANTLLSFNEEQFLLGSELYTANASSQTIQVLPAQATGNVAPIRSLGGATTLFTTCYGMTLY